MQKSIAQQQVLVFDPERCTGCRYCEIVCAFEHYGVLSPEKSSIRALFDEKKAEFEVIYCQHCEEPLCVAACTKEAMVKDRGTGWVKINPMKCVGCKDCIFACPLSLPWFDEKRRVAFLCDFCDGESVCAKYCSPRALRVVSRAEAWEFNEKIHTKTIGSKLTYKV